MAGVRLVTIAWSAIALVGWAAGPPRVEIGGRLMPTSETRVDVTQLLRTIGFDRAGRSASCIMPEVARPVFVLAVVWMLATMVVAVRQALDYESTSRAVSVCAIGWLLSGLLVLAMGLFVTPSLS